jgi:hypothetical protein
MLFDDDVTLKLSNNFYLWCIYFTPHWQLRLTFRLYMTFLQARIRALRSKDQGCKNVGGVSRGSGA